MTYITSYDAIQAKYRPLTPSRNETIPFFSHPYPFIPHTHNNLIYAYNKYSSSTEAVNEKLFISLTDKWYIWLVLYLKMEIKPNIDL